MSGTDLRSMIVVRLFRVLDEMRTQRSRVVNHYPPERLSFEDEIANMDEWLGPANEFGIAYECIVASLELAPFTLSSTAAIALLEVGLLMRFKTDRECDAVFDSRSDA